MTAAVRTNIPLVLILWVAGLGAAAQFGKIAVLYDPLGAIYPGHGIGLMVSVVGLVGLVFGATAGLIVERLGFRRVLVGALALGGLISVIQSFLPSYPVMMATRVIEGFSHLAIVVAGPALIAQVTAPRHFGAAMSLWSSFFGVSFALMAWAGVALADWLGIPALYLAHAALMAGVSLTLEHMIPDQPDPAAGPRPTLALLWRQHAEIYASPRVAAPALGFVFYTAMYVALLTLLPTQFQGAERILVATAMPLVSIAVSLTLGVWLLGRYQAVNLVVAGFAATALAVLVLSQVWDYPMAAALAALALAGSTGLVQGASFASIPQLNATGGDRARAAGAIAQLGNLGTTTGTPILALLIVGHGTGGIVIFVLPLALGGIAMTLWLAARRR